METTLVAAGKVRVIYRDMAFLGQESTWASEAANCAAEQGKFWEYHDRLFAMQSGRNAGTFSKDNLKQLATTVGLGTASFNACVDQGRYSELVQQDVAIGRGKGVQSTPTVFLNGEKLDKPATWDDFLRMVDARAQGAGSGAR
ncbi:MAG: thioredoxin domain-containing protein [Chloroflexi bacterium]|nr:thioredoxin domain-containing protein [Chloroflexota bacterium]